MPTWCMGLSVSRVHAKLCMVVRREKDGIRRYVHLGTGTTMQRPAGFYTDFGLFSCDPDIGDDVADLFNFLTGYARINQYPETARGTGDAEGLQSLNGSSGRSPGRRSMATGISRSR